ncbi:hypothetical protein FOZ60_003624 [Perkinsus olseni]|uniref:Uncharacterized protein n=1 Tax=Perkinsus olseni TaxID=32597 RepID=A0A7J6NV18_PEROL|nr:hypothetical protein FOZ60_003624 [Perkinsus olseni]
MMNSIATWLLFAVALITSSGQDVGRFAYNESLFSMHYDVNENREVSLTVVVPNPRSGRGDITPSAGLTLGPYPLRTVEGFSYTVVFGNREEADDGLHTRLETFLRYSGVLEPGDTFISGDLTTLNYTSADSFVVNLRGQHVLFIREGRNLSPGKYDYKETVFPHLGISYNIYDNGLAGVQVECEGRSTARFHHKLSRRNVGVQYLHYAVEPAGQGTLEQFLYQVRYVCPWIYLRPSDFSKVVVATEKTIYVVIGGGARALTKL